jgi:hypothetical protein
MRFFYRFPGHSVILILILSPAGSHILYLGKMKQKTNKINALSVIAKNGSDAAMTNTALIIINYSYIFLKD